MDFICFIPFKFNSTLPATTWGSSHPRTINRRRHRGCDSGCRDVTYDGQGLFQGLVGPQHLIPPLGLLLGLIHQGVLVSCRVQARQQLRIDEVLHLLIGENSREERTRTVTVSTFTVDVLI